jgi:hypothetical protein
MICCQCLQAHSHALPLILNFDVLKAPTLLDMHNHKKQIYKIRAQDGCHVTKVWNVTINFATGSLTLQNVPYLPMHILP